MSRSRARPGLPAPTVWRRLLLTWLALPLSALAALLIGALLIIAFGANPITGYHALLSGAFGGSYALASTAQKAVPLLLVAVGICIAVRASVWNIGGEGQIVMGALASTATALALPGLPAFVLLPLVMVAAAVGGAIWAGIAGFFKAYFNVNEILSTIMLNLVAVQVMNYLLSGPMINKSQSFAITGSIPQTKLLSEELLAADHSERDAVEPRRGHRRGRRRRRVLPFVAHGFRLPDPRRWPVA